MNYDPLTFNVKLGEHTVRVRISKVKSTRRKTEYGLRQHVRMPTGYTCARTHFYTSESYREDAYNSFNQQAADRYVAAIANLFG
jgi:hypothetical protein